MADAATPIEPTWEIAAKVWWAFIWRSALFSILIGIGLGMIVGFFGVIVGLPPGFMVSLSSLLGIVLGVSVSVWAMKMVLNKKFKQFQIVLIQTQG